MTKEELNKRAGALVEPMSEGGYKIAELAQEYADSKVLEALEEIENENNEAGKFVENDKSYCVEGKIAEIRERISKKKV